jgi:hypothetical protein
VATTLAFVAAGAVHVAGLVGGAAVAGVLGGLLFARDTDGAPRKVAAATAGGLALAAGLFVAAMARSSEVMDALPPALEWLTLGGAAGFVAGLGVVGREVAFERRPALEQRAAVALPPATPDGELGELLSRAVAASRDIDEALGEPGEPSCSISPGAAVGGAAAAARQLVDKIARFAARWCEIERQVASTDRLALVERMERMVARARAAADDAVRADYLRAERALRQQLDDLDCIRGFHERAVARLHHHVAVLERLRLASVHRRSADAGWRADELVPLVDELGAASLDLDGAAEALAELP